MRAHGHRRRVLPGLGPQIDFRAEVEVADVVAGPALVHARIAIDDAAEGRVVDEQRTEIAIDARVDEERSEDLGAILHAERERAGEIGDVGVALNLVGAAPVAARRPLAVRQHFGGGHEPQAGVAEERRRRRARAVSDVRATDGGWAGLRRGAWASSSGRHDSANAAVRNEVASEVVISCNLRGASSSSSAIIVRLRCTRVNQRLADGIELRARPSAPLQALGPDDPGDDDAQQVERRPSARRRSSASSCRRSA